MIRERIKSDLQKAIGKSGLLSGNLLDNIEWFWENLDERNFAQKYIELPVGRLGEDATKLVGADRREVWLRGVTFAKIRGWRTDEGFVEHPEIDRRYFRAIPLVLAYPEHIIEDTGEEGRYLFVGRLEKQFSVVVEIGVGEKKNWVVTAFMVRERYLKNKEEDCLWHKKMGSPAGTAVSPILAPATHKASQGGGSRFSTLQDTQKYYKTLFKKCQVDILEYAKAPAVDKIHLEHSANPEHGDYSSNIAMILAKKVGRTPMEIANVIAQFIARQKESELKFANTIERVGVAPPGFINFFLKKDWLPEQVGEILEQGGEYGINEELRVENRELRIQVEFISANPTGPLHAGNARGGFAGDVLANVLEKVGYQVQREYYINDKGVQVEKLAESVRAYQKHLQGLALQIPEGGYSGEYVKEIAQKIHDREKNSQKFESLKSFAIDEILKNIKKTVARMGIKFDEFFSEQSLYDSSQAQKAIDFVKKKNLLYEKDGAVWFKSSKFGDDKDRVLIKSDGEMTYLVSDLAYHLNKFEQRKFDRVILFWGADHHGYVKRFMAMMEAIEHKGKAEVELIQLLKLARGGKEVRMSKRAGEYVTVDEVLDEIGLSAARFHFLATPLSTPMTLDLAKAKEESEKNPVYYVQYAHARLSSILRKSPVNNLAIEQFNNSLLTHPTELSLIRKLIQLPEIIVDISQNHEVHRLPQYSIEVADAFHRFYENCRVLSDDKELTAARLGLVRATQIILAETLRLMGISAPEKM